MAAHSLDGRIALITGASRGIGACIARRFAREGAAVAVTARTLNEGDHRFEGSVASTVAAIRAKGGTAVAIAADLSQSDDRERIFATTELLLGSVDILVNNAAITYFTTVIDFDLRRWQLMFDVQVLAPFHLAQLVLPNMLRSQRGWILNISSPAAQHPALTSNGGYGGTVYGMCKSSLERFSTGLAAELFKDHVAVNALSPTGLVVTPGVHHHRLDELIPTDRHEKVEVMAEAALLLCSRPPQTMTGRVDFSQQLLEEFDVALPMEA